MPLNQPSPPADTRPNPYLPAGPEPLVFEEWQGLDTSTSRAGVSDKQAYWIDGFLPIAPRTLRTLPDIGTALYVTGVGRTAEFFAFYNIAAIPYMAVFLDDGSVVQVNVNTQAQTTILPAAAINNPVITNVGWTQWGSQYFIITAGQTNGYWIWDGSIVYAAGTLGPIVILTNPGSGYQTTPTIVASGGHGSGATFAANIANGVVTSVIETNPGSGYQAGDTVSLNFSGGNSSGTGATLTAVLTHAAGGSGASLVVSSMYNHAGSAWGVNGVSIINGGTGYSQFTNLTFSGGAGGGAQVQATAYPVITGGAITSVVITGIGGTYYNPVTPGPFPIITVSDVGGYFVSSVTVNNAGSGYSPSARVTASGGGSPVAQAALSPVINSGTISSVAVVSGGFYGSNTPPTLAITDSAVAASATVTLMPFGVSGTGVATYQGHVWIISGPVLYFSAPGSFTDFATSDAGGNATDGNSYLRVNYTGLISANGFLWLIGDSSVDYISGVQTSGTPPTTTYTQQNADPETGSPYSASIQTFGHDVWMANSYGIHVINGSNVQKISEPLDGVWNNVANFGGLQLSSAKATVFNKKVWMVLSRLVNPITGVTSNKLAIWYNKKWFMSSQGFAGDMTYISSQEINSVLTAYGTDGHTIAPLFNTPSPNFLKLVSSRYWDNPSYMFQKYTQRFWGVANYGSTLSTNLIFTAEKEFPASNNTFTITGPSSTGYFIVPPQAIGQQGRFLGMSVATMCADVTFVSFMMDNEIVGYRG